jgi:phage replication-related protein YjqB (UPF0714/DUF867 family)
MSRYAWFAEKRGKNVLEKNKGMSIQLTLSRWNRSDAAVDESETHRRENIVKVGRIKKLAASTHI